MCECVRVRVRVHVFRMRVYDRTSDKVLKDAVAAGARIGAIFKEPTITPTKEQQKEMVRALAGSVGLPCLLSEALGPSPFEHR